MKSDPVDIIIKIFLFVLIGLLIYSVIIPICLIGTGHCKCNDPDCKCGCQDDKQPASCFEMQKPTKTLLEDASK